MLSSIPISWGFSPQDGSVTCSCPCLPLLLRTSHPVIPMPGSFINFMEIQMSPCHPTGCFPLLYLQADAHECSQQHQIRADLCFSLTDILGENLFSPHLQGRFSKQSSPQGSQNQRPWTVPLCPSRALPIQPRLGIPGSWRAHQVIWGHSGGCRNSITTPALGHGALPALGSPSFHRGYRKLGRHRQNPNLHSAG